MRRLIVLLLGWLCATAHADVAVLDDTGARVVLVEAGPRLLAAFPESLSASAKTQLEKLGIEVRLGQAVTQCDDNGVVLSDGAAISSGCILWAAGVMASRAAKWLHAEADRKRTRPPTLSDRTGQFTVQVSLRLTRYQILADSIQLANKDGVPLPKRGNISRFQEAHMAYLIASRDDVHRETLPE